MLNDRCKLLLDNARPKTNSKEAIIVSTPCFTDQKSAVFSI